MEGVMTEGTTTLCSRSAGPLSVRGRGAFPGRGGAPFLVFVPQTESHSQAVEGVGGQLVSADCSLLSRENTRNSSDSGPP